jgi:hypothetical protein
VMMIYHTSHVTWTLSYLYEPRETGAVCSLLIYKIDLVSAVKYLTGVSGVPDLISNFLILHCLHQSCCVNVDSSP